MKQLISACSLGLFLLYAGPTYAETISPSSAAPQISVSSPTQNALDPKTVLQQLAQSNVVYLGETHDSAADHQAQLDIIQALHQKNPKIAIAMEMFQRPYQSVLDRYLAGEITETQLKQLTEYEKRWGFSWDFYAPILRFARSNKIPVVALNTPTEVTRKVSRQGLNSLTPNERGLIPPVSEIRLDSEQYRERIRQIYDGMHHGKGNSDRFEKFFLAQVLWDETMAEGVSQFLKTNRDRQVIVLTGKGHVVYGDGIPSRVTRRIGNSVRQSIVLLNPPPELQKEPEIADFFWKNSPN
jgi:uncharacterized iron-regulated protein